MKLLVLSIGAILLFVFATCSNSHPKNDVEESAGACADSSCSEGKSQHNLYCKLTKPDLKKRKETVLAGLRKQVLEHKELSNGYAFRFKGTDSMVDVLSSFIKSERQCCDFFTFSLIVKGDSSSAWLQLTGPREAKVFIKDELAL